MYAPDVMVWHPAILAMAMGEQRCFPNRELIAGPNKLRLQAGWMCAAQTPAPEPVAVITHKGTARITEAPAPTLRGLARQALSQYQQAKDRKPRFTLARYSLGKLKRDTLAFAFAAGMVAFWWFFFTR